MMTISVIIPVLNEEESIPLCLQSLLSGDPGVQVIVVDGGSTDRTREYAEKAGVVTTVSSPGRGIQMNAGARMATGDILLFLHADTFLPEEVFSLLRSVFQDPNVKIGCFRTVFDGPGFLLKCYSFFTRFDSVFTSFGDQGIVVKRNFFQFIGGFPDWPLFEDVQILRNARRVTRVRKFRPAARTSSRRFLDHGVARLQVRNLMLLMQFLAGRSPFDLAQAYEGKPYDGYNNTGGGPMRKIFVALTFFLLCIATLAGLAQTKGGSKTKEPYDGFAFAGQITEKGKEGGEQDTLVFAGCEFRSAGCVQYGFADACYKAGKTSAGQTFEVEASSTKEGTMKWKGIIKGDVAEATVIWTKRGQKPIEYSFTGKRIASPAKKAGK